MSSLDITRPAARNCQPGLIVSLIESLLAWNDLRMTRKALLKLSDRELDDIGLSRFDVVRMR